MKILHLIDSLSAGGAERVAVNMVNMLNQEGIEAHLCSTRNEGPLKAFVAHPEKYLFLERKGTFDLKALMRLIRYTKEKKITILHAHSSSFFIAVLVKLMHRSLKVVWHDHYGLSDQLEHRRSWSIRLASFFFDAVFSVNNKLKLWAQQKLFVKVGSIKYLANYADLGNDFNADWSVERLMHHNILSLANLRPQKDHHTLLLAFQKLKAIFPAAKLYMVGKDASDTYSTSLKKRVREWNLPDVFFMGEQPDVVPYLHRASIGVLSSSSEGLPIALLEYGLAGLPVICTDVGECGQVLKHGEAGWLIPPADYEKLAEAMQEAFENPEKSKRLSSVLFKHVQERFSVGSALQQVINQYASIR